MPRNKIVYVVKTYDNKERFRTTQAKRLLKHAHSRGKSLSFQTQGLKFLEHTLTYIKHLPTKRRPYTVIEIEFKEQW